MVLECRPQCGACCIAPSISSPIPGMPEGKKAGERCVQLDDKEGCLLFGLATRPKVCLSLKPSLDMCGQDRAQAMQFLQWLEQQTRIPMHEH